MDTCICMAVSLCCPPETIRTLLISYAPMQSKKFFFKKTRHLFHHLKNRGSMQSIWNSAWEIFLFSHNYVLNHLFILVYIHGCFILCVIIQYYVIYFVAQIDPTLPTGNSFSLAPISFQYTPPMWFSVFELFFFFLELQDVLDSPFSSPRISHFDKTWSG